MHRRIIPKPFPNVTGTGLGLGNATLIQVVSAVNVDIRSQGTGAFEVWNEDDELLHSGDLEYTITHYGPLFDIDIKIAAETGEIVEVSKH